MSVRSTDSFVLETEGNMGLTPVDVCVTLDDVRGGLFRSIPVNLTTIQGSAGNIPNLVML